MIANSTTSQPRRRSVSYRGFLKVKVGARLERSDAGRHDRRRGVKVCHAEEPGTARSTNKVRVINYPSPSQARVLFCAGGGGQAGEARKAASETKERGRGEKTCSAREVVENASSAKFEPSPNFCVLLGCQMLASDWPIS